MIKFVTQAPRTRAFGALAVGALALTALSGCGGTAPTPADSGTDEAVGALHDMLPEGIKSAGKITIGGTFDNPPVLYASEADATVPAGVAPDLSAEIGELLGVDIEWSNVQWPGQLPGLDAGTLDVVWGQATVTVEREKSLYDMIPFYAAPLAVLVPEGNPQGITSFETMCGALIGTGVGTIFDFYIEMANEQLCAPNGRPAIRTAAFSTAEEVALQSGQAEAMIDTFPVLESAASRLDGFEAVALSDAELFDSGLAGITFAKTNPELAKAFEAALAEMFDDGSYARVMDDNRVPAATLERDQLVVNYLTGTAAGSIVE